MHSAPADRDFNSNESPKANNRGSYIPFHNNYEVRFSTFRDIFTSFFEICDFEWSFSRNSVWQNIDFFAKINSSKSRMNACKGFQFSRISQFSSLDISPNFHFHRFFFTKLTFWKSLFYDFHNFAHFSSFSEVCDHKSDFSRNWQFLNLIFANFVISKFPKKISISKSHSAKY